MRESDGEMKHEDHVSLPPSCQKGRRTDADATKVDKAAPRRPRQPKSTQIWARDHGSAALRRQREERHSRHASQTQSPDVAHRRPD